MSAFGSSPVPGTVASDRELTADVADASGNLIEHNRGAEAEAGDSVAGPAGAALCASALTALRSLAQHAAGSGVRGGLWMPCGRNASMRSSVISSALRKSGARVPYRLGLEALFEGARHLQR